MHFVPSFYPQVCKGGTKSLIIPPTILNYKIQWMSNRLAIIYEDFTQQNGHQIKELSLDLYQALATAIQNTANLITKIVTK